MLLYVCQCTVAFYTLITLLNVPKSTLLKYSSQLKVLVVNFCESECSVLAVEIPGVTCLMAEMDPCLILEVEME